MELSKYIELYKGQDSFQYAVELATIKPPQESFKKKTKETIMRDPVTVDAGILIFTEESSHCWAGPFPGNAAVFQLKDFTDAVWFGGSYLVRGDNLFKEYSKKYKHYCQKMVTTEFPIELRMYGNDDTSYSKYYKEIHLAKAELDLFKETEPLDFHEIVQGFNFIFSN